MACIVFEISGKVSDRVYVGYCPHDAIDPPDHFLIGATRSDDTRNDVAFLALQEGAVTCSILMLADSEVEAFDARNAIRASNPLSITGPSRWPEGAYDRSKSDHPGRYEESEKLWNARKQPNARGAYSMGLWSYTTIKQLSTNWSKSQIMTDLDALSPDEFSVKYALSVG